MLYKQQTDPKERALKFLANLFSCFSLVLTLLTTIDDNEEMFTGREKKGKDFPS